MGYLHSSINPFYTYDYPPNGVFWGATGKQEPAPGEPYPTPRDEISLGLATHYGNWKLSTTARADLRTHSMVNAAVNGSYEDECFIFSLMAYKRYTSIGGDHGDSAVMFQVTFKTVGQFGFHPM